MNSDLAPRLDPDNGATLYQYGGWRYQLLHDGTARAIRLGTPGLYSHTAKETVQMALADLLREISARGGDAVVDYLALVVGDFWRKSFNSKFDGWTLDRRVSKDLKTGVRLEADTWIAAYKCLRAINESGLWHFYFPTINLGLGLVGLIGDAQLVGWCVQCVPLNDDGNLGKRATFTQAKQQQQGINASLKQNKNPFAYGSLTHAFTEICLVHHETCTFLGDEWRELQSAKSQLLQHWIKSNPIAISAQSGEPDLKSAIAIKKGNKQKSTPRNAR